MIKVIYLLLALTEHISLSLTWWIHVSFITSVDATTCRFKQKASRDHGLNFSKNLSVQDQAIRVLPTIERSVPKDPNCLLWSTTNGFYIMTTANGIYIWLHATSNTVWSKNSTSKKKMNHGLWFLRKAVTRKRQTILIRCLLTDFRFLNELYKTEIIMSHKSKNKRYTTSFLAVCKDNSDEENFWHISRVWRFRSRGGNQIITDPETWPCSKILEFWPKMYQENVIDTLTPESSPGSRLWSLSEL